MEAFRIEDSEGNKWILKSTKPFQNLMEKWAGYFKLRQPFKTKFLAITSALFLVLNNSTGRLRTRYNLYTLVRIHTKVRNVLSQN